jgi:hypothetical protein
VWQEKGVSRRKLQLRLYSDHDSQVGLEPVFLVFDREASYLKGYQEFERISVPEKEFDCSRVLVVVVGKGGQE